MRSEENLQISKCEHNDFGYINHLKETKVSNLDKPLFQCNSSNVKTCQS